MSGFRRASSLLLVGCLVLACSPVLAFAPGELMHTYLNPTPAYKDGFGRPIVVAGNNILMGSPGYDDGPSGTAYLFGLDGTLMKTFTSPNPSTGDYFGVGLATMGNDIVVGARRDDTAADNGGAVYLLDGNDGSLLQTFVSPSPASLSKFGETVGVINNKILVTEQIGPNGGSVYMFSPDGTCLKTIQSPTPTPGDTFGVSLAVSDDNFYIGEFRNDTGATDAGAVHMFDDTGTFVRSFYNPTPEEEDLFGHSLAILPNKLVVGAWKDNLDANDAGGVYVFDTTNGNLLMTIKNPEPNSGDYFGFAVAAVGDDILVGAYGDNTGADNAGSAYLFDGATGQLLHTFRNPNPTLGDQFSNHLSAIGDRCLIGAWQDDTGATNAGVVYLFEAVPEPSTIGLLLSGFLGLFGWRRRS